MAWEARLGLKHVVEPSRLRPISRLNGLGSPSGIETRLVLLLITHLNRLNGLGSPSVAWRSRSRVSNPAQVLQGELVRVLRETVVSVEPSFS